MVGSSTFKSSKGKYKAVKWDFQWGEDSNYKTPVLGSMDIFWKSTIGLLKVHKEQQYSRLNL